MNNEARNHWLNEWASRSEDHAQGVIKQLRLSKPSRAALLSFTLGEAKRLVDELEQKKIISFNDN